MADLIHDENKSKLVDNNGVPPKKPKKKSFNILKVAVMLLRRRPSKPSAASVEVASKGTWKRLIGSMRPLHLQTNPSPEHEGIVVPSLPSMEPAATPGLRASPSMDSFEDVISSPFSTNHGRKPSSTSLDGMSQYASAINLPELDQTDDDKDENDNKPESNMNGGDDMIDAKAEMFIARFYEQMRLQRDSNAG